MAIRTTKLAGPSNEEIALELAKAALLGGALGGNQKFSHSEVTDAKILNSTVTQQSRLDAAYAARLYQVILERLSKPSASGK